MLTDLLRVVVQHLALHLPPVVGDVDLLPVARPECGVSWQRGEEARAQDPALAVVTNLGHGVTLWSHVNSPGRYNVYSGAEGRFRFNSGDRLLTYS